MYTKVSINLRSRILLLALIGMSLLSCHKRDEYASSTDPMITIYGELSRYQDSLETYDGYWLLRSFPDKNLSLGGYSILLKFSQGQSEARGSEFADTLSTSYYELVQNESPTLSFVTDNKIVGYFYAPSSTYPTGRGGDIEYLIEGYKDGVFTLKGRRSGNVMTLTKFTGEVTEYLQKIKAVRDNFVGTALALEDTTNTSLSVSFHPSTRQLELEENGQAKRIPFRYVPEGIEFYEPVTLLGKELSGLNLSEDKTQLVSADSTLSFSVAYPPIDMPTASKLYYLQTGYVCQKMLDIYKEMVELAKTTEKGAYTPVTWGYLGRHSDKEIGLKFAIRNVKTSGLVSTYYTLSFLADPKNKNLIHINDVGASTYWRYSNYGSLLKDLIVNNSPYKVTNSGNYIGLTSTKNSAIWFYVVK